MAAAGIPFLKLSGLLVKTLSKPFANKIKEVSGDIGPLRSGCVWLGQTTNYLVARMSHFTTDGLNYHKFRWVELKESKALKNGAEILSESIVLGTAASIVVVETVRNAEKKRIDEIKRVAEQKALDRLQNERLEAIEKMLLDNQRILDEIRTLHNNHAPPKRQGLRSLFFWRGNRAPPHENP